MSVYMRTRQRERRKGVGKEREMLGDAALGICGRTKRATGR